MIHIPMIIAFIIIVTLIVLLYLRKNQIVEGYNDEVGKYCLQCKENNTINKCLSCYNCVWIHDLRKCVHGNNVVGPYDTRLLSYKWSSG